MFGKKMDGLFGFKVNRERLSSVESNRFFLNEVELLTTPSVREYYSHLIDNVAMNKENPNNSYVMWVCDKVDRIDVNAAAKNREARVALPDIDVDFEARYRQDVIQYLRDKYGADKVCQMSTFSRMQGRAAMKDVLRSHSRCGEEEANRITEFIPDESEISDQLQEMREETGEASIIRWALEHNGDKLKDWCYLDETGELQGPLALDFAQAIRLEGTYRNMSRHASGVIISSQPLADIAPMLVDKSSGHAVIALSMIESEAIGFVKFDILGLQSLDKIHRATDSIRRGYISAS